MALFFDIGTDYTKFEKELLEKNRLLNERLEAKTLINEQLTKQLSIQGVGCSLPTKEEIALEFAEITKQDNKVGCPKNESEAYKRGFIHGTIFKRTKGKSDM
jgi:hypothetical protein